MNKNTGGGVPLFYSNLAKAFQEGSPSIKEALKRLYPDYFQSNPATECHCKSQFTRHDLLLLHTYVTTFILEHNIYLGDSTAIRNKIQTLITEGDNE